MIGHLGPCAGSKRSMNAKHEGGSWAFWKSGTMMGKVSGVAGRVDGFSIERTRADWDRVLKWFEASR